VRRTTAAVLVLALFTTCTCVINCGPPPRTLERKVVVNGHTFKYRVWLPSHYTKLRRWPVILFLHGSGERGDDNLRQLSLGLGPALERYGDRYKAVVVFPQCRFGEEWYGEEEQQALAALEQSIREFRGDRRRIYLTGASMGGAGVWYMARHRKLFAALVPVCGEVARQRDDPFPSDPPPDIARIVGAKDPYATLAQAMGKQPVWVWHGADDEVVPVSESRRMVAALERTGDLVHYTEVKGVGHDVWDVAYGNADLARWLMAQRLR
jgi:predicted peptidase